MPASGRNRGAQSSGGRRTAEGAEELLRLPGAQAPRPWSTLLPPGRLRAPPPNRWLGLRASVGTVRKHLPRPPRSYHLPPYPAAAHFPVNLVPGLQAVPDAPHPPQAIPLLPQFLPFQVWPVGEGGGRGGAWSGELGLGTRTVSGFVERSCR